MPKQDSCLRAFFFFFVVTALSVCMIETGWECIIKKEPVACHFGTSLYYTTALPQ